MLVPIWWNGSIAKYSTATDAGLWRCWYITKGANPACVLHTVPPNVYSIVYAPSIKKHDLLCEYLSHWLYKELYLFTGHVSSARVVDHLSITSCILWAREKKKKPIVSSQEKMDPVEPRALLGLSLLRQYSLRVFWAFLMWLAWQGPLRTVQKQLQTQETCTPRGLWVI